MAQDYNIFRSLSGSEIHAVFGNVKFADVQMIKYAISRQKAPVYTMGSPDLRTIARGARSINGALIFSHLSTVGLVEKMREGGPKVFLSHDELANYNAEYKSTGQMTDQQRLALKSGGTLTKTGFYTSGSGPTDAGTFDPFAVGNDIVATANHGKTTAAFLADQLPPFDITLVGIPETAGEALDKGLYDPQSLVIRGVEFVSEASGTSISDLVIEKQMSFLARSIDNWRSVKL